MSGDLSYLLSGAEWFQTGGRTKMTSESTITPTVGMGATALKWTELRAGTIIEVSASGKRLTWQRDVATRTDSLGMSDGQEYAYRADKYGVTCRYSLRSNGRWVKVGEPTHSGMSLALNVRDEHFDFRF